MTPAARIQSAIEILDQVLDGAPAEQALIRWARQNRYAGSKDRAAIRDHVFDAVRCKRSFAAISGTLSGRGLMLGALVSAGTPLDEVFSGEGYAPARLSDDERDALREPSAVPLVDRVDLPDWIWGKFQESLGAEAEKVATFLKERAPVFLRVNTRKSDVHQAIASLKEDGIDAIPHALSPTALEVVSNQRRLNQSAAYLNGFVELQDAASQAVCDFLNLPSQGRILDYCAGGGGKSLAMAARTDAKIIAHDASSTRMKDIPARASRAGVQISVAQNINRTDDRFDLVFCDVPCSGSGSWRRSPDGKWQLTPSSFDDLLRTQKAILSACASLVSDGGELAYATCSVLAEENQQQIRSFISDHPQWRLIAERQFLPQEGGDGFYVARLTRA